MVLTIISHLEKMMTMMKKMTQLSHQPKKASEENSQVSKENSQVSLKTLMHPQHLLMIRWPDGQDYIQHQIRCQLNDLLLWVLYRRLRQHHHNDLLKNLQRTNQAGSMRVTSFCRFQRLGNANPKLKRKIRRKVNLFCQNKKPHFKTYTTFLKY